MNNRSRIRRFSAALAAAVVLALGAAAAPAALTAEAAPPPCQEFCSSGWAGCFVGTWFGVGDSDYCDAWYDGCMFGCAY